MILWWTNINKLWNWTEKANIESFMWELCFFYWPFTYWKFWRIEFFIFLIEIRYDVSDLTFFIWANLVFLVLLLWVNCLEIIIWFFSCQVSLKNNQHMLIVIKQPIKFLILHIFLFCYLRVVMKSFFFHNFMLCYPKFRELFLQMGFYEYFNYDNYQKE